MPVIHILTPRPTPPPGLLDELCAEVAATLGLPQGRAWAVWTGLASGCYSRPAWTDEGCPAPVVFVRCKDTHEPDRVEEALHAISRLLAEALACDANDVYVAVQRVAPGELLVDGEVWNGASDSSLVTG